MAWRLDQYGELGDGGQSQVVLGRVPQVDGRFADPGEAGDGGDRHPPVARARS